MMRSNCNVNHTIHFANRAGAGEDDDFINFLLKLAVQNGTIAVPILKYLDKVPDGVNRAIQDVLIDQATSEWLDTLS